MANVAFPDFENQAELSQWLLATAAQSPTVNTFLTTVLPKLAKCVEAASLQIVQAIDGVWTDALPTGETSDLPFALLATVADTEEMASETTWIAAPLKTGKREVRSTPAILLAAGSASRSPEDLLALQNVATLLRSIITLVADREKAARQLRITHMKIAVSNQLSNNGEELSAALAIIRDGLLATSVHILPLDETQAHYTSGPLSLSWPVDAPWLTTLHRSTNASGATVIAQDELDCLASIQAPAEQPIRSAVIAAIPREDHDSAKHAATPIGLLLIVSDEQSTFDKDDAADAAELARCFGASLSTEEDPQSTSTRFLGQSQAMIDLRQRIERIAPTELPALIVGENGTGKEVASRRLHELSPRAANPFLAVNCGALTETLLESELFGHEKGAFTDAAESRAGKFEAADGGTLFLDEIGELTPRGQVKLLRVLEDKIIVRVGGTEPITTDTRVLAATNRDLAAMVRSGDFREDLFFRLNAVTIELPPLRDRPQDIAELAEHFLAHFSAAAGRPPVRLSAAAIKRLRSHPWPGNVRELRNVMERLAFLATSDELTAEALGLPEPHSATSVQNLNEATRAFQIAHIESQIAAADGNMTDAAARLGLHRSNLYRKMKQLGVQTDENASDPE
jgi:Nif-specific regulatory protein